MISPIYLHHHKPAHSRLHPKVIECVILIKISSLTERDVYGCDKCDCGATSNRTTSRDPCFVVVGAIYGRKLSLGGLVILTLN
jgi:hypothetical protein